MEWAVYPLNFCPTEALLTVLSHVFKDALKKAHSLPCCLFCCVPSQGSGTRLEQGFCWLNHHDTHDQSYLFFRKPPRKIWPCLAVECHCASAPTENLTVCSTVKYRPYVTTSARWCPWRLRDCGGPWYSRDSWTLGFSRAFTIRQLLIPPVGHSNLVPSITLVFGLMWAGVGVELCTGSRHNCTSTLYI